MKTRITGICLTTVVSAAMLIVVLAPFAGASVILTPTSYVSTHGRTGGQPVSHLDLLDETGIVSSSARYVQFQAKSAGTTYAGYRTYTLPAAVDPNSMASIQVQANFLGRPSRSRAGRGKSSTGCTTPLSALATTI